MGISSPAKPAKFQLKWFIFPITGAILIGWLWLTPSGLLGKADAVAYAVCHRILSHSFQIDGQQFPLCARCTGMYLGALLGLAYQSAQGKLGKMPPLRTYVLLALLVAAFGIDGVNSYLHFIPGAPSLYQPQNWLRLVTGTGMGLAMASVLLPSFHQTMWKAWVPRSAVASAKQLVGLLALAVLLVISVLSGIPFIALPLALLGSAGVITLLTMVYSMVWVMLFKKDNTFERFSQLWLPLLAGFTVALLQIGVTDFLRYTLTRTWSGFSL